MVEISFDGGKTWDELTVNMRTIRLMKEYIPEVKTGDDLTRRFMGLGELEPVEMIRTLHVLCMQVRPGITEDEMLDVLDNAGTSPLEVACAIASAFVESSFFRDNDDHGKKKVFRITGRAQEVLQEARKLMQSTSKHS